MTERLEDLFKNPPADRRSLLFWSWNDELDEEEIRRQIGMFAEGGAGGFFIHAREGLKTEYMREQWLSCVEAAVEEAKRWGITAWLYDEDRWPSGGAAGSVCRTGGDRFRCKGLTLEVCSGDSLEAGGEPGAVGEYSAGSLASGEQILARYAVKICSEDRMAVTAVRQLPLSGLCELKSGETLVAARVEISGKHEWFHNESPVDLLNPEAVACFIKCTHEIYASRIGKEFGSTVPGIFTDEPSLADRRASFPPDRGWLPWTWGFEEIFRKKRGYDILSEIPYLYFSGEGSRKIRHDYWRTVGEQFCDSYSKQIGDWCNENGISYTGHFLQEDKLGLCTRVNGAVMPHYQYQQIPGIDWIGEQTREYLTVKQCSSVANQLGKPTVIAEMYAGTGWEFTFEGQKWIGDFQYVLGVNRRCQHLAFYSLKGMRKRDYPPSFHYNNTWWSKNSVIEAYFARLGLMVASGDVVRDILVLHPSSTAWSRLGTSPYGNPVRRLERDVPDIDAYGDEFNSFLEYLCKAHFDFDLGDESLMEAYGSVEGKKLRVGQSTYSVVIVPPVDTVLESTRVLIEDLINHAGCVIVMTPAPRMTDGVNLNKPIWDMEKCIKADSREDVTDTLEQISARRISVTDRDGRQNVNILYMLRRCNSSWILFLVNNNREEKVNGNVILSDEIQGVIEEWDLLTGSICLIPYERNHRGELTFSVEFGEADSKLYRITTGETDEADAVKLKVPKKDKNGRRLAERFPEETSVFYKQPNILVLDECRFRLDSGIWHEAEPVWEVQKYVREKLGYRPLHINGGEQWYSWINEKNGEKGTEIEMEFRFCVKTVPGPVYLVMEQPENYEIICNGSKVFRESHGYFLDRAFRKILLPETVRGENTLVIRCSYQNQMELENCYIIGDFGVDLERGITELPGRLRLGDWTKQGLPHYCGSVVYYYEVCIRRIKGHFWFQTGQFSAACAALKVNGRVFEIPWKAAGLIDVTVALKEGNNIVELELYGTPRNMLGPFCFYERGKTVIGSGVYTGKKEAGNRYFLEPYGLMTSCELWEEI